MRPILFQLGGISIYSYGLMVAVGFLTAIYLAQRQAGKQGGDPNRIIDLGLVILISGIIGGRFLYVLLHLKRYLAYPLEIFMLAHGGLVFYGGLIFGVAGAIIFLRRKGMPVLKTADLIVPYVALGHAIGRVGCFLNGCCYGRPTTFLLKVRFAGEQAARHPAQLYSALLLFALYLFLRRLYLKPHKDGHVALAYFIFYPALRIFVEHFRGDNLPVIFKMTFSQLVSLGVFGAGVCIFLWVKFRKPRV